MLEKVWRGEIATVVIRGLCGVLFVGPQVLIIADLVAQTAFVIKYGGRVHDIALLVMLGNFVFGPFAVPCSLGD